MDFFSVLFFSDMPISVSNEQALSHSEVRERLATNLHILQNLTRTFLERITSNRELIPYGLLYMARVLRETLHEKFPKTPDKELLKVLYKLINYSLTLWNSIQFIFLLRIINGRMSNVYI